MKVPRVLGHVSCHLKFGRQWQQCPPWRAHVLSKCSLLLSEVQSPCVLTSMNMAVSENVALRALFTLPESLAVRAAAIQIVINQNHRCFPRRTIHPGLHTFLVEATIELPVNMDRNSTHRDDPKGKVSYYRVLDCAGIKHPVDNRSTRAAGGDWHNTIQSNESNSRNCGITETIQRSSQILCREQSCSSRGERFGRAAELCILIPGIASLEHLSIAALCSVNTSSLSYLILAQFGSTEA